MQCSGLFGSKAGMAPQIRAISRSRRGSYQIVGNSVQPTQVPDLRGVDNLDAEASMGETCVSFDIKIGRDGVSGSLEAH